MKLSLSLAAAVAARRRLDWRAAAIGFTAAADAIAAELNPHQTPTAAEIGLRRDAHLALCRTIEFQRHRERARSMRAGDNFVREWRAPSGDLVCQLLGTKTTGALVIHQRELAGAWA